MDKPYRRLLFTITALAWLLIVNMAFFSRRLLDSDFLATLTGTLWRH